jgi:hypothetical protein
MNNNQSISLAPVCLFVYNRIGNTRKTINALERNMLAKDTDIFIFSDGGRDKKSWDQVYKLRKYLHKISGFKSVTVIERTENFYLERNTIEGVTEVVNKFGAIIVLEDDVVTGQNFLTFMNSALDFYKDIKQVMHISGFCFVDIKDFGETVLWKYPEGYGWATWRDRWNKFRHYKSREEALDGLADNDLKEIELDGTFSCLNNLNSSPIPWDICWYINIYRNNGLCLTPTVSLVKNIGLYAGTHFSGNRILGKSFYETKASNINITNMTTKIDNNYDAMVRLKCFYANAPFNYNYFGEFINMAYPYIKAFFSGNSSFFKDRYRSLKSR